MFGFLVHYPEDVQEKLLVFQLPLSEGTVTKDSLLTELCGLIAGLNNSSDAVSVCKYQPRKSEREASWFIFYFLHYVRLSTW